MSKELLRDAMDVDWLTSTFYQTRGELLSIAKYVVQSTGKLLCGPLHLSTHGKLLAKKAESLFDFGDNLMIDLKPMNLFELSRCHYFFTLS